MSSSHIINTTFYTNFAVTELPTLPSYFSKNLSVYLISIVFDTNGGSGYETENSDSNVTLHDIYDSFNYYFDANFQETDPNGDR